MKFLGSVNKVGTEGKDMDSQPPEELEAVTPSPPVRVTLPSEKPSQEPDWVRLARVWDRLPANQKIMLL